MIYLAAPYTHSDPDVVEDRYNETMDYTAYLLEREDWVYSPIVHCHVLAKRHQLPTIAPYWRRYNLHALARCDELYVLGLEGWKESLGVMWEVDFWECFRHPNRIHFVQNSTRQVLIYEAKRLREMMRMVEEEIPC